MSALELQVYEILKAKLGEQEASKVIEYFDAKAEEKINILTILKPFKLLLRSNDYVMLWRL